MSPSWRPLIVLGVLGCGNITATEEGVATLLLEIPSPAEVEVGQTIVLSATPLDADGEALEIPVYWIALDTTIAVDSAAGRLTGLIGSTTGRVVARTGNLYSGNVTFSVLERADTLVQVGPPVDTVLAGDSESAELTVRLDGGDPQGPISGRVIVYELVFPTFGSPEDRSVDLTGDGLLQVTRTTSSGLPLPGIHLRRRAGHTAPDSAVVTASTWRPGGELIPGSGLRFIIRFTAP